MIRLYKCQACQEGRHSECEIANSASKGLSGESRCVCQCKKTISIEESTTRTHWEVGLTPFQQGMIEGMLVFVCIVFTITVAILVIRLL